MLTDLRDYPSNDSKQIFGELIHSKRKELSMPLRTVAKHCDVSINFISLVERGQKTPSDKVIVRLSEVLDLDENLLFDTLNRVHPAIRNNINTVINEHKGLKELFGELAKKVKEEDLREELYTEVYNVYADFLKRHNLDGDDGK